ncbi:MULTISPECIES: PA4780 family RIO1-like protein kinase [unclassified Cupriavidus]|uniref:PA4780 family RIO1-like protein kinase n=1 Tax=Cupriavidus TaxID=106589 RepID=UPI00226E1510|nr:MULTISPECIES: PA4780 family RIO1-like protein kinase [unclassified Cupriavidus]MCY0857198.1 serine protein kinase RIO [Cupriavidus sp. D39]MDW3681009.1 PA4780 family RIO1-like protein kinase [Cupriavidus sp. CV2]
MKTPKRLQPLVEDGLVDEVLRQLMSGKEATVYVVRCGGEIRCAKVYKDAAQRSFRQASTYQEGRKVKNSRQARAMEKGTRYGRKVAEEAWHNAEVDALYRLAAAGVRVPTPHLCFEGVLLMELVVDAEGNAAPRLNDVALSPEQAVAFHDALIEQVILMLCAGVVHGDLSEFNILVDADGPVIIDLPQAVDAAGNSEASAMLERDVDNLAFYFGQFEPALNGTQYGKEIWALYQAGLLHPGVKLTGQVAVDDTPVDVEAVLAEVEDVRLEEEARQRYLQSAE